MAKYWRPTLVFKEEFEEPLRDLARTKKIEVQDLMRDAVLALLANPGVKVVNSGDSGIDPNSKAVTKLILLAENQIQHAKQVEQSAIELLEQLRPTEGKYADLANAGGGTSVTALPEPARVPQHRKKKA